MRGLFTCMISLLMGMAHAQIDPFESLKVPAIGDHIFTRLEKPTFVDTYVGNNLGVGINSAFRLPLSNEALDTLIGIEGELLFASLNIEYQQQVREWMSLSLRVGLNARVGTELGTLLLQGYSSANHATLGWLSRLYTNDKVYISLYYHMKRVNGSFINLASFVQSIINGETNLNINQRVVSTSSHITLNGVYAANDLIAFVGNAGGGFANHWFKNRDVWLYSLHVAGDLNFYRRWDVPVGFYFGYEVNNNPELLQNPDRDTNIFFYKINYTGSNDFNFTIEGNNSLVPLPGVPKRVNFTNVIFSIRVYFQ